MALFDALYRTARGRVLGLATLAALGAAAFAGCGGTTATFDEITVKRINVVDENGSRYVVLAGPERFPLPVLEGREYPRDIDPGGMVFYDRFGNEVGGIGIVNVDSVGEQVMFLLDYTNSEAIGLVKFESEDGSHYETGLSLFDRQPLGSDVMKVGSVGKNRISVTNENGDAQIVLRDSKGRSRIRLAVTADDQAVVEMLDTNGMAVQSWGDE